MDEMIAFCGIVCSGCPAHLATINDDDSERKKTAEVWSKLYNSDIKPEDINCDGCPSEGGTIFNYCKVCEIRKCGQEKGLKNCAYCDEYICEKLDGFFKIAPDGKAILDKIREGL